MPNTFYSANKFAKYSRNNFSQFGEDGIIESILDLIPKKNNWCVEFGAWDGICLSNTYNLIKNKNYKSVLIEADKKKFQGLKSNLKEFDAIVINEFVMISGENTLDKILGRTPIPNDFDFLSIDIDGNDYYILESLDLYKPKVICIEYNPTIPNEVNYIQPKDFNKKIGSSAMAILELANSKGYKLAAITVTNLILIIEMYWPLLKLDSAELSSFRDDRTLRNFIFTGYDGSVHLSQPLDFPWHGFKATEKNLQVLPQILRKFTPDYNFIQKILLFKIFYQLKIKK